MTWKFGALVGAVFLCGCDQPQIRVYEAPKEPPREMVADSSSAPMMAAPPMAAPERQLPKVTYKLPKDWMERAPNEISIANFSVTGAGGKSAGISIAPLPRLADREAEVVNMWREQMGLKPLDKSEIPGQLTEVDVAGTKGKMFEVTGPAKGGEGPQRIITVMVHEPTTSWFYKISGDDALVTAQKDAFLQFLKSVHFEAASAAAPSTPSHSGSGAGWKVPAEWTEESPGAMQVAKFQVPAKESATAEVTVSVFPSDTGGDLANVNRWRGQIGLGPVDEQGLVKVVQPLDQKLPGAILVDMENQGQQLIGAIVPRNGRWFFYKLKGAAKAVAPQKDAFIGFVLSAP